MSEPHASANGRPGVQTDLLQRALADERSGRLELAREHYRQAIEARPDDAQAHYLLGNLERRLGERGAALEHLRRAAHLGPRRADILETLGRALADAGDADGARDALTRALAADPRYARTYVSLGDVWRRKGFAAEAERHYRQASECDPTQAHAQLGLGRLLRDRGEWDRAERAFEDALTLAPTLHAARVALACLYNARRRFEAARQAFEQCRRAGHRDPRIATGLAYASVQLGNYDEALAALDAAPPDARTAATARALRGRVALALGDLDAADAAFVAALERVPRLRHARLGRIAVQALRGDCAGALVRFVELNPDDKQDLDVAVLRARLLLGTGQPATAARVVGRWLERKDRLGDRDRFTLHLTRGQIAEEAGDLARAWHEFEAANACLPRRYDALATRQRADAIQRLFSAPRLPAARPAPATPIMIAGLPGSGARMLAAALGAHPAARTVALAQPPAELAGALAGRIGSARAWPQCLLDCRRSDLDAVARELWPAAFDASGATACVLDGGDEADFFLGLFLALVPNLRVVHCMRDRGDQRIACLRHDYAGPPRDFCRHPADVDDRLQVNEMMMGFWREQGVRALGCRRETLISRPVDTLRRVLAFARLDYRDACLAHLAPRSYAPSGAFHTPVFDPSIGRQRRYAAIAA